MLYICVSATAPCRLELSLHAAHTSAGNYTRARDIIHMARNWKLRMRILTLPI